MSAYESVIDVFYRPEMVVRDLAASASQSPLKPRLVLEHLERAGLGGRLRYRADWEPFAPHDFEIAHRPAYVRAFFAGEPPLCHAPGIPWSRQYADSVRYTNASLYHAIRSACLEPGRIAWSPTSGFHHARPDGGSGFCAFSGQVIAGVRVLRELGAAGAWIDLDGHVGNSIEDSREFVPELNCAVPLGCNVNPGGSHARYLGNLEKQLSALGPRLASGEITYIAFAHGADSHEWDDHGYQCSTAEWLEASRMVYRFVRLAAERRGRPIPLVLCLFGGYREDHYDSVLALHAADLVIGLNELCGAELEYRADVRAPRPRTSAGPEAGLSEGGFRPERGPGGAAR